MVVPHRGCSMRKESQPIQKKDTVKRRIPLYRVVLHNDDVNEMVYVVSVLHSVFRFDVQKSFSLMLEAHNTGAVTVVVEPFEHAEFHRDKLCASFLTATIEPDG